MRKLILISTIFLIACGGSGGDSNKSIVFEGELTEGVGETHTSRSINSLKHEINEGIEDVEVCAVGRCSKTDENGAFGFAAPDSFNGGDVEFSLSGHEIEAKTLVSVSPNSKNVFIHFKRTAPNKVVLHHLTEDGATVSEEESHSEESHSEEDSHSDHNHLVD